MKVAFIIQRYVISYLLFADVDTEIYPCAVPQYHMWPNAKCSIVVLSGDKFMYSMEPNKSNKYIYIYNMLKWFWSSKYQMIPLIWPKPSYECNDT